MRVVEAIPFLVLRVLGDGGVVPCAEAPRVLLHDSRVRGGEERYEYKTERNSDGTQQRVTNAERTSRRTDFSPRSGVSPRNGVSPNCGKLRDSLDTGQTDRQQVVPSTSAAPCANKAGRDNKNHTQHRRKKQANPRESRGTGHKQPWLSTKQ